MMKSILIAFLLLVSGPALACPHDFVTSGADPTGVADATPVWNGLMAAEVPCLRVPAGEYSFQSPLAEIRHAPHIFSDGPLQALFWRDYSNGTFIAIRGKEGGKFARIALLAGAGTTGGHGLDVRSENGGFDTASSWVIEDVQVGGPGSFGWPCYFSGERTDAPAGLRVMQARNLRCFNGEHGAVAILNSFGMYISGLWTNGNVLCQGGSQNILIGVIQGGKPTDPPCKFYGF